MNRQVNASSLGDRSATLFYGVIDGTTRRLQYVNAGRNPPMACLAIFPNSTYEQGAVHVHPEDLILAHTDGMIEAVNPAGDEWGAGGLRKAAAESDAQCADDVVHAIFTSMDDFSRGHEMDDATVVVIRAH